jgi:predicted nuclease of predicted toxin-antitoxin system
VKVLLDENLSWRLKKILETEFEAIKHVTEIHNDAPLSDEAIWDYALLNSFLIVTNDDDFYRLSVVKGFPPKVLVLRTGNQSTSSVGNLILKNKSLIEQFYTEDEYGVFELF